MTVAGATPQEEFSTAVERTAVRALDVLRAVGGADVTRVAALGGSKADLAAVRILGADLFSPYLLTGLPLHPELEEATAMADAFRTFPPEALAAPALPAGAGASPSPSAAAVGWRDWATAELLGRCGARVSVPEPPGRPAPLADGAGWKAGSAWMAQLSPLALPGLDSPVHEWALRNPTALGRGTVRAMLRRDYRTAARIARWLALGHSHGVASPVALGPLLRHVRLFGGPGARTALDVGVGERLAGAVGA